jgi:hypothetical protein
MKSVPENSSKMIRISSDLSTEKVHIPDSFEESDAESESLSDKIRKLEGYGEIGQTSSKQGEDRDDHQVMLMKDNYKDVTMDLMVQHQIQKQLRGSEDMIKPTETPTEVIPS